MTDFLNSLLDYIFYRKCYLCGRRAEESLMCGKCVENIKAVGIKKTKKINGVTIEGYFFYKDEIKKLIRGLKYHNKKSLAKDIAKIFYDLMDKEFFLGKDMELVPVPLHTKRQQKRTYNHMELIAQELSFLIGCGININLIKRVKNTMPQYKLSQKERRENLKEAFNVSAKFYSGNTLVLMDDIATTGVTMEELIKELRKNNINKVTGLVLAHLRFERRTSPLKGDCSTD